MPIPTAVYGTHSTLATVPTTSGDSVERWSAAQAEEEDGLPLRYPTAEEEEQMTLRVLVIKNSLQVVHKVWAILKQSLRQRGYTIREKLIEVTDDFTDAHVAKYLDKHRYDYAIGAMSAQPELMNTVYFTYPLIIDENVLYFRKADDTPLYRTAGYLFFYKYLPIVVALFILGMLCACIVHLCFPSVHISWVDAVTAMFGNFHFTKQRVFRGTAWVVGTRIGVVFVLLVLSAFTLNLLTAFITTQLLETKDRPIIDTETVRSMHIAAPKGISAARLFKSYGAKVTTIHKGHADSIRYFLSSTKYDAITSFYGEETRYPGLRRATTQFGMDAIVFVVHRDKPQLRDLLNALLMKMNADGTTKQLCVDTGEIKPEFCML